MIKTIQEQIEIMQHYAKFNDEVEQLYISSSSAVSEKWQLKSPFPFDWYNFDYRIKEQKKTITIEKWLVTTDFSYNFTVETDDIERLCTREELIKVKRLDYYEVEL